MFPLGHWYLNRSHAHQSSPRDRTIIEERAYSNYFRKSPLYMELFFLEKHFTLPSHRTSFLIKDLFPFGNRNSSGHFVFKLGWYWEPFAREDDWRPVLLPLALGGRKHLGLSDLRKSPSIKILVLVSGIHYQTASHQSCIAWCQYNYQNKEVSFLPHANTKIILYWSQNRNLKKDNALSKYLSCNWLRKCFKHVHT